jgi:calcium/calmodulin-dependent protein kinase I
MNKETGERCAIKFIDKSLVKNKPEMLQNEIDVLLRVDHPNIIALRDIFDTSDKTMLCMELCVISRFFDFS